MKKHIISWVLLALVATGYAFAQSNPGFVLGQVPTAAQWNSYFSNKLDYATPATGFVNRFRNGTFDFSQRLLGWSAAFTTCTVTTGLSVSCGAQTASTKGYVFDGWIVTPSGATVTVGQSTGNNGAENSIQITGAASVTNVTVKQRIESIWATPLAGSTVMVQFQYKQDTGGAITPNVSTCYASAIDNFTTCTSDLASTALTSCASGSWCTEAYVFTASANASNGYEVTLDCNAAINTGSEHCLITAADIRVTPGLSTGIPAAVPPPELRSGGAENALNFRYLWALYSDATNYDPIIGSCNYVTATAVDCVAPMPGAQRALPTLTNTASLKVYTVGGSQTFTISSCPLALYSAGGTQTSTIYCTGSTAAATAGFAAELYLLNAGWFYWSTEL